MHRLRKLEGKDGNALNEVRVLSASIMQGGGKLQPDPTIKLKPETSLLGLAAGDEIALGSDDFARGCPRPSSGRSRERPPPGRLRGPERPGGLTPPSPTDEAIHERHPAPVSDVPETQTDPGPWQALNAPLEITTSASTPWPWSPRGGRHRHDEAQAQHQEVYVVVGARRLRGRGRASSRRVPATGVRSPIRRSCAPTGPSSRARA